MDWLEQMESEKVSLKEHIFDFFYAWFKHPYVEARYWLRSRFHPKHRYHIIKTGLKPGYYDQDVLILHACMTLLERYIAWHDGEDKLEEFTKELKDKPNTWGCDANEMSPQVKNQTEALAIYRWWKYERPANEKRLKELYDLVSKEKLGYTEKYKDVNEWETKIREDEQKMLHRLINIRFSLWE
jgi:hypothetical protein